MKKDYPLVFKYLCNEVLEDLEIENISIPRWSSDEITIYLKDDKINTVYKNEIDGWVFENRITLDIENIQITEREISRYESMTEKEKDEHYKNYIRNKYYIV